MNFDEVQKVCAICGIAIAIFSGPPICDKCLFIVPQSHPSAETPPTTTSLSTITVTVTDSAIGVTGSNSSTTTQPIEFIV